MDLDKGPQIKGSSSSLNKTKKSATTPVDETVQHIGSELCQIEDYRVVFTKSSDNLKRRAIVLVKENNTWGFTLQTYGIHHKATKEVEMLTYVDYVEFDGPAHKAGMRAGDVILSINGESMENIDHPAMVDHIMKCGEKMRMVVFFEDCVKKVDMHQRIIKLQKVLEDKEKEFLALEEQERRIVEGTSMHSSGSEYETDDEDNWHKSTISIEITPPEMHAESPARRASMLGNQFVQMFAPDSCASTNVGAVSPTVERFQASPSFGRRVLRRQAPLERDYKETGDFVKLSPRLVHKERHFQPISSSDDSEDEKESKLEKKGLKKTIAKGDIKVVAKGNVKVVTKHGEKQIVAKDSKHVVGESVSHVDSIDDSGLQVVVNKKAAAFLGLCDMTPESQKVRKRSSSSSQGPSPVPEQKDRNTQSSSAKPQEIQTADFTADLTVSKKAARFLGLCEPELESKKPHRSHSANEKDMARPSSEVFAARSKEKDGPRPQSQFFVARPGEEDDSVFSEQQLRQSERRRSSQFYISLDEIEGDARDSVSSDSSAVKGNVSKNEGKDGKSETEHSGEAAIGGDSSKSGNGAKSRQGPLVYHYNKRPGHILQISKSSSLGDLYPMEEHVEGRIQHREPKFIRSQSEAVEIGYGYGSLGRKRIRKKRMKGCALVHSQSVSIDATHGVKDRVLPHSSSTPAVQETVSAKLRSEHSAPDIPRDKKIELGEVVIGPGTGMQSREKTVRTSSGSSPKCVSPSLPGTQLTRHAPWGEGDLEKFVDQKLQRDNPGSNVVDKKVRKRATSHGVAGSEKEHDVRTKSESDVGQKTHKKKGIYVVASGSGFSEADLEIPVFEDKESEDVKLIRYEYVNEESQIASPNSGMDKKVKKHKSRKKDRSARSALETEKLNESRGRSPVPRSYLNSVAETDGGLENEQNNEMLSPDIPKVHSSASSAQKTLSNAKVHGLDKKKMAQNKSSDREEHRSKTLEVKAPSFQETESSQSVDVIEESVARKFSFDGTYIRLGELINEDDEITWL